MNISESRSGAFSIQNVKMRPGMAFGIIIITALIAFEAFNYSTTDYALRDLLGDLRFAGIRWATILSIAFCGIDFAGIARLFTPEQGSDEPKEVWYLFGAWMLAATMNAILTWWGVSMAINNHQVVSSSSVVAPATLTRVVPIFVSIMVWVIRILIIGSLSYAGDRIFSTGKRKATAPRTSYRQNQFNQPDLAAPVIAPRPVVNRTVNARSASSNRPTPDRPRSITTPYPEPLGSSRQEPTYHSLSARSAARPNASIGEPSDTRH